MNLFRTLSGGAAHSGAVFLLAALSFLYAAPSCTIIDDNGPQHIGRPEPEPFPVYLDEGNPHNGMTIEFNEDGTCTVVTTNGDPWAELKKFTEDVTDGCSVLDIEYKAEKDLGFIELFFMVQGKLDAAVAATSSQSAVAAADWTHFRFPLKKSMNKFGWGKAGDCLRMDFGQTSDNTIQIRSIAIVPMNDEEKKQEEEENNAILEKERYAQAIKDYLAEDYVCEVSSVEVAADKVTISGTCPGEGAFFLGEVPPFVDMFAADRIEPVSELASGAFTVTVDRKVMSGEYEYDRLLSKWAVFKAGEEKDELVSHARYADPDRIHRISSPAKIELKSKKGLGGLINHPLLESDLEDLGIASATINFVLDDNLMSLAEKSGYTLTHEYGGRTYWFNEAFVRSAFDEVLRKAAAKGVSVAGILLVSHTGEIGSLLKHPDFTSGVYTMPDMTDVESFNCYAAALDFLAQRYSGEDMRVAHWIMHNEVDGGIHWTNMGEKPLATYMDTYARSMRICYNIAHQYDQNAEVFMSFSHGWTAIAGGGWYSVKEMIDMMVQFGDAEGDFFWSLACHSYPSQLGEPRVWMDKEATYSMDTEYVTLKNLEVLDKWVKMPEHKYNGERLRSVWLSEAGTCSPVYGKGGPYTERALLRQAAGFAYGWKKINALDGISGIQWHNWFDNDGDGVQLGLRQYGDDRFGAEENGKAKPVWHAYQKAGTPDEDAYFSQEFDEYFDGTLEFQDGEVDFKSSDDVDGYFNGYWADDIHEIK